LSTEPLELAGAFHLHTGHSDGAGDAKEVTDACAEIGLDFAVVTDHDSLALRELGAEGWHGKVLLAVASEISTKKNFTHLLGLNVTQVAPRFEHTVHESLQFIRDQGGRALLAHAHGRGLGGRGRSRRDWPWWSHPHLGGAEIWNYLQDWGRTFRLLDPGSYRLDRIAGRIAGPPDWVLSRWDAEAELRPFAGIAGNDNHAKRLWPLRKKYWPHEEVLGRLINRVRLDQPLSTDGAEAARQLMTALAEGKCIFARDELASSRGFALSAEYRRTPRTLQTCQSRPTGPRSPKCPTVLRPGDTGNFEPGVNLVVESPVEAELRICRLGNVVASTTGTRLEFSPTEPGAYRAEARLSRSAVPKQLALATETRHPTRDTRHATVAWAFTNHVRLT
jgi:hypothetical protein